MRGQNGWFYAIGPPLLNWEESKFGGTEIEFPVVVTWRSMKSIDIFPKISGSALLLLLLLLLLGCYNSSSSSCCCFSNSGDGSSTDCVAPAAYYYYYYYYNGPLVGLYLLSA
jgi:hypothetical protein